MSLPRRVLAATPIALLVLGLGAAPATAQPDRTKLVQHVTATFTSQVPTDAGFTATADVVARGQMIATQALTCTGSDPGTLACDFTLTYADGQVVGSFVSPDGSRKIDGIITSGTGTYTGATGSLSGRATATGARVTIHLTLPKP